MLKIPLKATPNQRLSVVLGDYNCTIKLYQRGGYLYLDLSAGNALLRAGAICYCDEPVLPPEINGFSGRLFFLDETGQSEAPDYAGLGTRYNLYYSPPEESEEGA